MDYEEFLIHVWEDEALAAEMAEEQTEQTDDTDSHS